MNKKLILLVAVVLVGLFTYRCIHTYERKHTKYYQLDASAEPYRELIEDAYGKWTEHTGIRFIDGYKPYRTVNIHFESLDVHHNKNLKSSTVGVYYTATKDLYIFQVDNFDEIFLHEVGHSIGLDHYDDVCDIMYPTMLGGHKITKTSLENLKIELHKNDYLLFY